MPACAEYAETEAPANDGLRLASLPSEASVFISSIKDALPRVGRHLSAFKQQEEECSENQILFLEKVPRTSLEIIHIKDFTSVQT